MRKINTWWYVCEQIWLQICKHLLIFMRSVILAPFILEPVILVPFILALVSLVLVILAPVGDVILARVIKVPVILVPVIVVPVILVPVILACYFGACYSGALFRRLLFWCLLFWRLLFRCLIGDHQCKRRQFFGRNPFQGVIFHSARNKELLDQCIYLYCSSLRQTQLNNMSALKRGKLQTIYY